VTKTGPYGEFLRRLRHCLDCDLDFTTYEAAGRPGGRFMKTVHLYRTLHAMSPIRRRIVENLIEELTPASAERINFGDEA